MRPTAVVSQTGQRTRRCVCAAATVLNRLTLCLGVGMRLRVTLLTMLLPSASLVAQSCEATFVKKGNPITGLKFTATQTVDELSTPDAINQLRGLVLKRGYDVLATEAEAGNLLLESPGKENQRSFPLVAQVTTAGQVATVQLRANLRGGVLAKQEDVRGEMCGILAELKGGRAGLAAASQGKNASAAAAAPTVMTAQMFADRVSKERDNNVNEIALRYPGRSFTLSGTVASVDRNGDTYRVRFDIMSWEEKTIRLPGESQFKTDIVCVLAPGQSVYALTLKRRSKVRLTGTYSDYRESPSPSVMWLSGCKPEQ